MSDEFKKNCNSCKYGLFSRCDTLKNNKEYQEITGFVRGYEFKASFICDEYKSMYIEYPIEVSKIVTDTAILGLRDNQRGKFVKVRPCGDSYGGKTYLGLYLGALPIGHNISHNPETKELKVSFASNPAIFTFGLNKIIYGCESWWGVIESEEDLKEITDADINDVWYVKALKELSEISEHHIDKAKEVKA